MVGGGFRSGRGSNLPFLSLQPVEHNLFYKEFPKMSSSALSILGPPGPGGSRGRGQICAKTLFGQVGMCVQNFIEIGAGVWISIFI